MCEIVKPYTDSNTYTGYKVAMVDKYGHYISPFTGYRYKKGKIKNSAFYTNKKSLHKRADFRMKFCKGMHGKTGVLTNLNTAKRIFTEYNNLFNACVLEMTIKDDLVHALFIDYPTIIGSEIVSFKKIKI